jgi:hypothetical protein
MEHQNELESLKQQIEILLKQLDVYKQKEIKIKEQKKKSKQRPEYTQQQKEYQKVYQKVYQKKYYNDKKEEFSKMKELLKNVIIS